MRSQFLAALLLATIAAPAQAALTDDEPANDDVSTAGNQVFKVAAESVQVGSLALSPGDLDFIGVPALIPGDTLTVSTTPMDDPNFEAPDTIIGVFDDAGTEICINDDAFNSDLDNWPMGYGSLCRLMIDTAGDYFVGVTGYSPTPFDGTHSETGTYVLTVTLTTVPEPAMLAQLGSGITGLALLARLRRLRQKQ